jgi:peptide-methionine (S)-S-oxide reductase
MNLARIAIISCITLISCAQNKIDIPMGVKQQPVTGEAVAYFAEGCFWHSEIIFQSLVGVRDAVSGYAGGTSTNPNYETVSSGETEHAETVQVFYDPSKISYETLVAAFFASQDPTTLNRQGNDIGTQYRSIAFYGNKKEKQIIDAEIKRKLLQKLFPLQNFIRLKSIIRNSFTKIPIILMYSQFQFQIF